MPKPIAVPALSALACIAFAAAAGAQIYVPPGQEFTAAPMSHGGIALPGAQILAPAPVAAPVVVAPPEPAPVPKKRRKKHK